MPGSRSAISGSHRLAAQSGARSFSELPDHGGDYQRSDPTQTQPFKLRSFPGWALRLVR